MSAVAENAAPPLTAMSPLTFSTESRRGAVDSVKRSVRCADPGYSLAREAAATRSRMSPAVSTIQRETRSRECVGLFMSVRRCSPKKVTRSPFTG
jgi:hypothetical protein